jgi:electron transfer flavoprotein alpha subunit
LSDVLCYSESPELVEELANAGEGLARVLGGTTSTVELDEVRPTFRSGGKIVLIRSARRISGSPELAALALAKAVEMKKPSVLLIGTTKFGRQVVAGIATQLKLGSLVEVNNLRAEGGRLTGERSVYAGKFQEKVSSAMPCIALVRQGAYPRRQGEVLSVEEITLGGLEAKVERVETRPKPKTSVDLKSAAVIVSAGRGIKRREDLELVERLANAVGGVVGCSRPLSSDLGWLGEEHHIGLTGVYVHPDLYIAVGISGQLQHVAGIKESKVIVAINKDKQAPIFQVADYGIVGDLYNVIPALLNVLERKSV